MAIATAFQAALANSIAINGTAENQVTGINGTITGAITQGAGFLEAASQPNDYVMYPVVQRMSSAGLTLVIKFLSTATTIQNINGTANTGTNYLEAINFNSGAAGTLQVGSMSVSIRGDGGLAGNIYTIAGQNLNNGAVRTVVVEINGATQNATAWVDGSSVVVTKEGPTYSYAAGNTEFGLPLFAYNNRGALQNFFSGRIYTFARLLGTGFDGASLSSNPSQIFDTAVTPIAFTGTIPAQSATVGTPFSLNVASYFSGTQTPFTYAIQSGTLPDGLSLSGSTISGTPTTAGGAVSIVVRGTDASSNTADSNSFTITVAAAAIASFTLTDLVNNAGALIASTSGITVDVYNPSTGALVVRKTGLTSTAGADVVVSDAALTIGTTYNVFITIGTAIGAVKATTA